jgi:hypothetical protein
VIRRVDEQDAISGWLAEQEQIYPRPEVEVCPCCGSDELVDGFITCGACHAEIDDGSDARPVVSMAEGAA